jgi:superfamily II DNA/RNA helicase
MLDMGFERDIRSIEAVVPDGHQTLLFTATWPKTVQKMADDLLFRPVKVTVGSGGEKLTASKNVEQRVHVITGKEKRSAFLALLQPLKPGGPEASKKVIVFCNTKKEVCEALIRT